MKPILTREMMERLARQEPEERARFLAKVGPADLLRWDAWFEAWADPAQMPPPGEGWRTWLLMAGRGFGKTRAGSEWVHQLAMPRRGTRIALVGATIAEAQAVMVEGRSGLIAAAASHGVKLKWESSRGRLSWPTGTVAEVFSGDSPDSLRGPEHHFAWVLTFEIFADAPPVSLGEIIGEVSERAIRIERVEGVDGYAAYGSSQGDALSPLLELHDIALTSAAAELGEIVDEAAIVIPQADLGAGSDEAAPRLERWSEAAHLLPAQLSVDHYDASRDYQQGRVTTRSGSGHRNMSIDAPMVLASDVARGMAEAKIARAFRERNRLKLRLPPRYSHVRPGQRIEVQGVAGGWKCIGVAIEQMVVELVLVPSGLTVAALPSDAGRLLDAPDVVASATSLALFDPADFGQGPMASMLLAGANANDGWRAVPTDIMIASQPEQGFTAAREAYLGFAENGLGNASGLLIDLRNEVVVQMVDHQHALLSLTDEDLLAGANLAMLGDELFQFGRADYLGSGRYRLSRLLRGRFGSEWACGGHVAGEAFCLVALDRLAPIGLGQAQIGAEVSVKADGMADELTDAVVTIARGEALRPPSPVHLTAAVEANGDVRVDWVRRSRAGYAWFDGSDAPMGETIDGYDLMFAGTEGSIARTADAQSYILQSGDVAALGSGALTISVAMRGEYALSRPASIIIQI